MRDGVLFLIRQGERVSMMMLVLPGSVRRRQLTRQYIIQETLPMAIVD